jgi:hypothetical protein
MLPGTRVHDGTRTGTVIKAPDGFYRPGALRPEWIVFVLWDDTYVWTPEDRRNLMAGEALL